MRKEVSIAIVIGIFFGAIILYGINLANNSTNSLAKPNSSPTPSTTDSKPNSSTKESTPSSSITINSHISHQVLFEKDIVLSGKTTPSSTLSVISENNEEIITSDEKGIFTLKIILEPGENNIQIDVVSSDNTLQSTTLKLYFSLKTIE